MSNTRRQSPDTYQFRQSAFASSTDYERGLLGNLVAARCQRVENPETVAVLWWLQQISWREGGIEHFAGTFIAEHPELVGTASMHLFGMRGGQVYNAEQVRVVRREIARAHGPYQAEEFPLRGERGRKRPVIDYSGEEVYEYTEEEADEHPISYPVECFVERCEVEHAALAGHLKRLLVDLQTAPERGLWNMPGLWAALCKAREREIQNAAGGIVETSVARQVFEELDYALEARTFVLIEGREGIGKSEASRAWCARNAGRAVYVRLESGSDETTLYRSIARALGTACTYTRKAVEMRARIQDTLQTGQLMLVLDEAHFLWPQNARSERAAPKRVDWLRTALVDFGVPVALVSTPQYFAKACDRFRKAGWNANQVQRRLARIATLPEPDALPLEDILAIARLHFPGVDAATLKRVAASALGTLGFLTSIRHLRQRVDFLQKRRPGKSAAEVVAEALQDVLPAPAPVLTPAKKPLKTALRATREENFSGLDTRRASSVRLIVQPEVNAV